ncbi:hypothetical protein [Parafrankia sp. EUN1f]|uniref:hypothetical protein n=1 Tax=Parafrankia sp. EUN1f TaxID=102897 RepID=UPI0001C43DBF|nr:hypothetical protein [Parafrankia sp. EUN1f]EFC85946.1 hypothetical protein FrEUN1fDRAFT_0923 [Parafrankia sp. EUN1f]
MSMNSVVTSASRRRATRLLFVLAALLVLRVVQAAVAGLTVLAVTVSGLEHPAPGLRMARLAEVEPEPTTGLTTLAMVLISAGLATVLLPRAHALVAFAGIKAFAMVAASAIAGIKAFAMVAASAIAGIKAFAMVAASAIAVMFTAEPVGIQAAVAGCGVSVVLLLWPKAREAATRVLAAIGLPHVSGPAGDLVLALKIALLVAFVLLPG